MKVVTLHPENFLLECQRLQSLVEKSFEPDIIVAIASGGVYVAELIFPLKPHYEITCRRPSTKTKEKNGKLFSFIKRLPLPFRNFLRKWEALCLSRKAPAETPVISFNKEEFINLKNKKILVVDDAVDSGATLGAVVSYLRKNAGGAEIKSAVITVTTSRPAAVPDFYLFNNQTLIRFPWSRDYQPKK